MSREAVIRRIVQREQAGQTLLEESVLREAPDLHQAAVGVFGAWETALQYAGIDPHRLSVKTGYSREEVLRSLQALCRSGYCLKAAPNKHRDRCLYEAARRYFGAWRKALEAAGVNLQHAGLGSGTPRRIDREKTLEALRQWLAAGHTRKWRDICLQNRELALAVKRTCGSWRRALNAMGLLPEAKPAVRKQKWSAQRILEGIRLRHEEGKPLHYMAMHLNANPLLCAAKSYFGSWQNALTAAGIKPEQRAHGRPVKKKG